MPGQREINHLHRVIELLMYRFKDDPSNERVRSALLVAMDRMQVDHIIDSHLDEYYEPVVDDNGVVQADEVISHDLDYVIMLSKTALGLEVKHQDPRDLFSDYATPKNAFITFSARSILEHRKIKTAYSGYTTWDTSRLDLDDLLDSELIGIRIKSPLAYEATPFTPGQKVKIKLFRYFEHYDGLIPSHVMLQQFSDEFNYLKREGFFVANDQGMYCPTDTLKESHWVLFDRAYNAFYAIPDDVFDITNRAHLERLKDLLMLQKGKTPYMIIHDKNKLNQKTQCVLRVTAGGTQIEKTVLQSENDVHVSKRINPKMSYIYRGDSRAPDQIFEEGFTARGSNTDLFLHVNLPRYEESESAYIATSTSKKVASTFPGGFEACAFVYEINAQKTAILINEYLSSDMKTKISPKDSEYYHAEKEIAVPYKIKPQDIKGAWPVELIKVNGKYQYIIQETFILNPSYMALDATHATEKMIEFNYVMSNDVLIEEKSNEQDLSTSKRICSQQSDQSSSGKSEKKSAQAVPQAPKDYIGIDKSSSVLNLDMTEVSFSSVSQSLHKRFTESKNALMNQLKILRQYSKEKAADAVLQEKRHVTNLAVAHKVPERVSAEFFDYTGYSQFQALDYICNHSGHLVFLEGTSTVITKEMLDPKYLEMIRSTFPDGPRIPWFAYTPAQKKCLIKEDAPYIALAFDIISHVYPTQDRIIEEHLNNLHTIGVARELKSILIQKHGRCAVFTEHVELMTISLFHQIFTVNNALVLFNDNLFLVNAFVATPILVTDANREGIERLKTKFTLSMRGTDQETLALIEQVSGYKRIDVGEYKSARSKASNNFFREYKSLMRELRERIASYCMQRFMMEHDKPGIIDYGANHHFNLSWANVTRVDTVSSDAYNKMVEERTETLVTDGWRRYSDILMQFESSEKVQGVEAKDTSTLKDSSIVARSFNNQHSQTASVNRVALPVPVQASRHTLPVIRQPGYGSPSSNYSHGATLPSVSYANRNQLNARAYLERLLQKTNFLAENLHARYGSFKTLYERSVIKLALRHVTQELHQLTKGRITPNEQFERMIEHKAKGVLRSNMRSLGHMHAMWAGGEAVGWAVDATLGHFGVQLTEKQTHVVNAGSHTVGALIAGKFVLKINLTHLAKMSPWFAWSHGSQYMHRFPAETVKGRVLQAEAQLVGDGIRFAFAHLSGTMQGYIEALVNDYHNGKQLDAMVDAKGCIDPKKVDELVAYANELAKQPALITRMVNQIAKEYKESVEDLGASCKKFKDNIVEYVINGETPHFRTLPDLAPSPQKDSVSPLSSSIPLTPQTRVEKLKKAIHKLGPMQSTRKFVRKEHLPRQDIDYQRLATSDLIETIYETADVCMVDGFATEFQDNTPHSKEGAKKSGSKMPPNVEAAHEKTNTTKKKKKPSFWDKNGDTPKLKKGFAATFEERQATISAVLSPEKEAIGIDSTNYINERLAYADVNAVLLQDISSDYGAINDIDEDVHAAPSTVHSISALKSEYSAVHHDRAASCASSNPSYERATSSMSQMRQALHAEQHVALHSSRSNEMGCGLSWATSSHAVPTRPGMNTFSSPYSGSRNTAAELGGVFQGSAAPLRVGLQNMSWGDPSRGAPSSAAGRNSFMAALHRESSNSGIHSWDQHCGYQGGADSSKSRFGK